MFVVENLKNANMDIHIHENAHTLSAIIVIRKITG